MEFVGSGVYAIYDEDRSAIEICLNCNMIYLAHYASGECPMFTITPKFNKYTQIGLIGFEHFYFGYYRQHTRRME